MARVEYVKEDLICKNYFYRVCHGFRLTSEVMIFGLILTTFESSSIFGDSWGSIENWLEPKTEPPLENLACPNP